ncbi:cytochrome c [Erythrobacter sp. HL-111]|uniref:c-type cytochrome n=1 Tax=Erythrobacter sp. HL-111 TaxID=1798193 RepID=UPI0006DB3940|nr:cytochrome c [Erythrobacter sp. HL-111]KPP90291.1 MAG: monoheme cytochrome C' [Erythrobacteraceae bacterium HL-111]SDR84462.1 Cytochrome c556 [Erythrobacter sp. HL-111]
MLRDLFSSRIAAGIALAAIAGTLAGCEGEGPEADTELNSPAIGERQDNFEGIADSFKAIRGQLEQENPDFAAIQANAEDINQRAGNIEQHFVEETAREDGYDTEALAAIWAEPGEFTAARQKLSETSAALVEAAASGEAAAVGAAVKEMGGSCKNCHDVFRYDDEA